MKGKGRVWQGCGRCKDEEKGRGKSGRDMNGERCMEGRGGNAEDIG